MKYPERREFDVTPEEFRKEIGHSIMREVWLVDEGDVWRIWCMDCGTRIGTVNADNVSGASRLKNDHDKILHGS